MVLGVKLSKSEDDFVATSASLCWIVKANNSAFVEDVFKDKVKTSTLYGNLQVISHSARFKPLG